MRALLFLCLFLPLQHRAQDARSFRQALLSGDVRQMDHWMKREVHRQRKGQQIETPGGRYVSYTGTLDSLVDFLARQPDVLGAGWDRCAVKAAIWPGRSTIGMRWRNGDGIIERCWTIQQGIPGSIRLLGWRPRIRKDREQLRYMGATQCPGFVQEERERCDEP